jgi:hypothetical protein
MLAALGNADEYGAFTEPVPDTEVGYFELVEEPIDLTTMAGIAKADGYRTMQEFRQHVALLISNALTWHPQGTDQHEEALALWQAAQDAYIATGGVEAAADPDSSDQVDGTSEDIQQNAPPAAVEEAVASQQSPVKSESTDDDSNAAETNENI